MWSTAISETLINWPIPFAVTWDLPPLVATGAAPFVPSDAADVSEEGDEEQHVLLRRPPGIESLDSGLPARSGAAAGRQGRRQSKEAVPAPSLGPSEQALYGLVIHAGRESGLVII